MVPILWIPVYCIFLGRRCYRVSTSRGQVQDSGDADGPAGSAVTTKMNVGAEHIATAIIATATTAAAAEPATTVVTPKERAVGPKRVIILDDHCHGRIHMRTHKAALRIEMASRVLIKASLR